MSWLIEQKHNPELQESARVIVPESLRALQAFVGRAEAR